MRILIIYCHPSNESFTASLLAAFTSKLKNAGHELTIRDLYKDRFDPVLGLDEFTTYREQGRDLSRIEPYVGDLKKCEGILLIYPTWWYGMPAILKGYFDRVWLPGTAFELSVDGRVQTEPLRHIRRFAVVTTYGSRWWWIKLVLGDSGRKTVERGVRRLFSSRCRMRWFACYGMDRISVRKCASFRDKVSAKLTLFDD